MIYSQSYQVYKSEHGLTTAAEQRAADVRAGEAAAALRDLRLSIAGAFRLGRRGRNARRPAGAVAGSGTAARVRALSGVR